MTPVRCATRRTLTLVCARKRTQYPTKKPAHLSNWGHHLLVHTICKPSWAGIAIRTRQSFGYSGTKRRALEPSTPAVVNFRSSLHLDSHCPLTLEPNCDQAIFPSLVLPDFLRTNTSHTHGSRNRRPNRLRLMLLSWSHGWVRGNWKSGSLPQTGTCSAEPTWRIRQWRHLYVVS